jgi:hypothetical protein
VLEQVRRGKELTRSTVTWEVVHVVRGSLRVRLVTGWIDLAEGDTMTLVGEPHSWDNESGGEGTDLDDCSGGLERILLARSALAHRKTPSPTHTVSVWQPVAYPPRTRVSSRSYQRTDRVGWSCADPKS